MARSVTRKLSYDEVIMIIISPSLSNTDLLSTISKLRDTRESVSARGNRKVAKAEEEESFQAGEQPKATRRIEERETSAAHASFSEFQVTYRC